MYTLVALPPCSSQYNPHPCLQADPVHLLVLQKKTKDNKKNRHIASLR
jgi:hypothetical protein